LMNAGLAALTFASHSTCSGRSGRRSCKTQQDSA
jgi:hypothetical protein